VWNDLTFDFTATQRISSGSAMGSVSQDGTLKATWDNDFLSLAAGPTSSLFVDGYRVDITPLGFVPLGGSNFDGGNPWVQPSPDVMADVTVTYVPDSGTTLALLGGALVGLGALRRKFHG
jgi:VPDSG-CTERM motif